MTTTLPEPGELGVEGHAQLSRRFLEHAREQLVEGDRVQAAEKVWGAAAHALKAVGEQRGWVHDRHPNIFDIGEHLGREFGKSQEFDRYLARAEFMHRNFYENDRSEASITFALDDVFEFGVFEQFSRYLAQAEYMHRNFYENESLVDELERIRNSPPQGFTVRDNDDRIRLGRLLGLSRGDRPAIGEYSPVGYSQTHRESKE
jgi:hypothetical protein